MDLQYKYVVRNGDGSVARWMAGDNFSLQTAAGDVEELPSTLRVSDSWDASVHAVEVWPAEARRVHVSITACFKGTAYPDSCQASRPLLSGPDLSSV
jgi:hypothetical protein